MQLDTALGKIIYKLAALIWTKAPKCGVAGCAVGSASCSFTKNLGPRRIVTDEYKAKG
jgi:hypothetical protein